MSIYGTGWSCDADAHADDCLRWVSCTCPTPQHYGMTLTDGRRHYRYDADMPCSCGAGPIVYRGSHILPTADSLRGGLLAFDEINDPDNDDSGPLPFLRVTIRAEGEPGCQDVVLTADQAESLGVYLLNFSARARRPGASYGSHREER